MVEDEIEITARRITGYAASILEAHALGHGPGTVDEPWTQQYQERAVEIYEMTLPWSYLQPLGERFTHVARNMTANGAPDGLTDDWLMVIDYLRNAGDVLTRRAPSTSTTPMGAIDRATPGVMSFHLLAEIVSDAGARRLQRAAEQVAAAAAAAKSDNPLTREELVVLRHLVAGDRVADVATNNGYSERSLYRMLSDIWSRIGASSRAEGIAIIVANGWLSQE
ncbi:MAG: hypothetical protein AAF467_16690 [Actinomycetota bacterium]